MQEIWKDVVGFEGFYKVSNFGRIKSMNWRRTNKEKILSEYDNGSGYKLVNLTINSITKKKYVHRLVAEAFVENPANKKYVNHLDYKRDNNKSNNLEWVTAKENYDYSEERIRKGIKKSFTEERIKKISEINRKSMIDHPERMEKSISILKKYSDDEKKPVKRINKDGFTEKIYSSISETKIDGFIPRDVSYVCNGKRKTHSGYYWEFAKIV